VARNGQSLREGDGNGQYFLLYGQNDMIWTMRLMDTATYCLSIVIYLYPIKYFTLPGRPDGILRAASFFVYFAFVLCGAPRGLGLSSLLVLVVRS
jgi:hypothetical protein